MTETKMLGIACASMLVASVGAAALAYWLNSGALAVIVGGTLAGIAAYVAVVSLCKPRLVELATEVDDHA